MLTLRWRSAISGDLELVDADRASVEAIDFRDAVPVRMPRRHKQQPGRPGLRWNPAQGAFIYYESRLELLALLDLERRPDVAVLVAQPFSLDEGRHRRVPDFLWEDAAGGRGVVDVKPEHRLPASEEKFAWTATTCNALGWHYEVMSEPTPARERNLRWLSAFRSPPVRLDEVAPIALDLAQESTPWGTWLAEVTRRSEVEPWLVLPCLAHLLWANVVGCDIDTPLSAAAFVGGDVDA